MVIKLSKQPLHHDFFFAPFDFLTNELFIALRNWNFDVVVEFILSCFSSSNAFKFSERFLYCDLNESEDNIS